jgi:hypothetical protein
MIIAHVVLSALIRLPGGMPEPLNCRDLCAIARLNLEPDLIIDGTLPLGWLPRYLSSCIAIICDRVKPFRHSLALLP